jgi:hypothetical protein
VLSFAYIQSMLSCTVRLARTAVRVTTPLSIKLITSPVFYFALYQVLSEMNKGYTFISEISVSSTT